MNQNTSKAGAIRNPLAGYLLRRNRRHPGFVLLGDAAAALTAYLFARTPLLFGAYPLGIALLSSFSGVGTVAGLLGALVAAWRMGQIGLVYGGLFCLTVGMRLLLSIPGKGRRYLPDCTGVFCELPQLRAAVAAIVGLGGALYQLLVGGMTVATLLFGLTMIIAPTVAALLFGGLFSAGLRYEEILGRTSIRRRSRAAGFRLEVAVLSLLFFAVLSLRAVTFFGLSVAYCFAAAATLFLSRRCGALRGCVAGLLISLGTAPLYAPAFALLGLFSGLLWEVGLFYALGLGVAAAAVWGSYIGGLTGFLTVTPELMLVSLLAWPFLPRFRSETAAAKADGDLLASEEAVRKLAEKRAGEREGRVGELAGALNALSRVFRSLSDTTETVDQAAYLEVCDRACTRYCSDCEHRADCWEKGEKPALLGIRNLSERLSSGQAADKSALPAELAETCPCLDGLLSDIRDAGAALLYSGRSGRGGDALAADCELVSGLLSEALDADRAAEREDSAKSAEVCRILRANGMETGTAAVYGSRLKWIAASGAGWENAQENGERIRRACEELCGCAMTLPEFTSEGGTVTLRMQTARRFSAETCRAYRAAAGSEASGDTVSFFENKEEYFYALLSDGMGSGSRAAATSGVACLFLENLLGAGNSKTTALKLLNNLIRTGGEENSATVDLLELDLLSGRATFIKSGAAPSYVKRGENLFRIRSKTVPLGLMKTLDAEKIRFDAQPGDVIVMLSDGVSQTPEDAPWLMELLSGEWNEGLPAMAQKIVGLAAKMNDRSDDLSVAIIRVRAIGEGGAAEQTAAEYAEATAPAVPPAEAPLSEGAPDEAADEGGETESVA